MASKKQGSGSEYPVGAKELRMIYKAYLSYRLSDRKCQCQSTANLDIFLAEEYAARFQNKSKSSHTPTQAERSAWYEFIGDFYLSMK